MKNILLLLLYLFIYDAAIAQTDSTSKEKRIDAFSIRPGAVIADEISIYYDRGINNKFTYIFSAGYLRKTDYNIPLEYFGSISIPFNMLTQGQGFALRFGNKQKIYDSKTGKPMIYVGLLSNFKFRHISNGSGVVAADDDNPDHETSANFSGNSYHLGADLILRKQVVAGRIFFDFFGEQDFFSGGIT